ncbi:hypothetical protein GOODEAATRI_017447 [Goodea atripinnis]|uniref:Uncharacterized protein n=1 Tax=Goodea atripinnis TaxID=208336 RepID=A0ABV0N285_9TELE
MRQPHSCPVRRNFLSGIQVEFKQSLHQRSLRAQLHWLQVDNQLSGAMFPIVFHPVPPPKSIALDSGASFNPLLTIKLIAKCLNMSSSSLEPKPFIDMSVIMRFNQHSNVTQFKYFMALVQEMAVKIDQGFLDAVAALFTPASNLQNNGQKAEPTDASLTDVSGLSFFEYFHISPVKVKHPSHCEIHMKPNGNGRSDGVRVLCVCQGAVQGPEEFAEGFAIGVRSLLGSTVGGAAGMFSKITGSMGKGLAAMTMDKEYQQERREDMNRPTKDFTERAKKEGAAGFFKGIGKGLVGVVARPTGSIVDMASTTFQGIQRVAEATEEVTKLRPVRLIKEDGIIRPYDVTESQGFDLYQLEEDLACSGDEH